jgi:3-deoxy-D-manno-oct-2-ulosonic acid (Kdo) hydroxylase
VTEVLTLGSLDDPRLTEGVDTLERGGLVLFPRLPFALDPGEEAFLTTDVFSGESKNVSYDAASGKVGGTRLEGEALAGMRAMIARYSDFAQKLLGRVAPDYRPYLQLRRTSFRPGPVDTRVMSKRKDDRRLHVDAFPSNPNQGRRILRVFTNVHPGGLERVWEVADDDFESYAKHWIGRVKARPGGPWLQALGLTKGRRTAYDSVMLQLHDQGKLDDAWQAAEPKTELRFSPGATWIVYTDSVLHAALSGQHLLEQTFYLPPDAMAEPARAPVRVLERLMGRPLL